MSREAFMPSADRLTERPDGVVLAAAWFIVVAVVSLVGVAAILVFAYPAVLAQATTGVARYVAIGGVSFGLLVAVALGAASVAGAVGLLGLRPWGRIWAIALAAVSLLLFPVGTIAGGLIIGYMLTDWAKDAFARPQRSVSAHGITIDLREEPSFGRPFSTSRVARMSWYKSRSAKLPHLGDDASLVLRSLESLRPHG
jgi:hypothetical protein